VRRARREQNDGQGERISFIDKIAAIRLQSVVRYPSRAIRQAKMKHRVPIAIFSLMMFVGILVTFLGLLLQGARSFPWFPLFGVGVAVFMFGFFFLLYSIIFGALEWGSKIGKSKRG
jgi:divalent metal cation (Fe/Co/Zn/Cd) transporter